METTKQCFKCLQEKPLSEFYTHKRMADGHLNKCKQCAKLDVNKHRADNLSAARAYDRSRGNEPHRVEARAEYSKTDAYKKSHAASIKRWAGSHPDRRSASTATGNAIRDGRMIPWPVCSIPECSNEKPQGHHPDYSRPLDVVWLCTKHHAEAHKMMRHA